MRSVTTSSPGSVRRRATTSLAPSMMAGIASANASPCPATTAAPHPRHRGRSASGTPTISQITSIGQRAGEAGQEVDLPALGCEPVEQAVDDRARCAPGSRRRGAG